MEFFLNSELGAVIPKAISSCRVVKLIDPSGKLWGPKSRPWQERMREAGRLSKGSEVRVLTHQNLQLGSSSGRRANWDLEVVLVGG